MKTKGLTLREAINSGKPYRSSGMRYWHQPGDKSLLFNICEVVASEWEIKVEPREFWILKEPGRLYIAYASQEHVERLKKQNYVHEASEIIHVKEVLE